MRETVVQKRLVRPVETQKHWSNYEVSLCVMYQFLHGPTLEAGMCDGEEILISSKLLNVLHYIRNYLTAKKKAIKFACHMHPVV